MQPVVMTCKLLNYDTITLLCSHLILKYDDPLIKEHQELANSGKNNAERKKIKHMLVPFTTLRHKWLRVLAQTCRWFKRCVYKYRRDTTQPTFDHLNQPGALYIERAMTRNLNKHNRSVKRANKLLSVEKKFITEISDAIIAKRPPVQPAPKKPIKKSNRVYHHMQKNIKHALSRLYYSRSKKGVGVEKPSTKQWPSYATVEDLKKAHRDVHVISIPRDMRYNGVRLIDVLFRNECEFMKYLNRKVKGDMKFCDSDVDGTDSFAFMISVPKKPFKDLAFSLYYFFLFFSIFSIFSI